MARHPEYDHDFILNVSIQNISKGKSGLEFYKDAGFYSYRSFQQYLRRKGTSLRKIKKSLKGENNGVNRK
ncbi:hypothetical protein [Leptospira phage LE4]|uniref:Uncharacterized protein n=1 Tax=Leptospira phage LE4 TaxID=2041383 RepID=A0A343LEG0_9CAUD|nr:hypothetical protein HWB34_gp57 [Leptospira phage LE4]ATN95070.1 hypothetical protein [Leptospira phage LE4]